MQWLECSGRDLNCPITSLAHFTQSIVYYLGVVCSTDALVQLNTSRVGMATNTSSSCLESRVVLWTTSTPSSGISSTIPNLQSSSNKLDHTWSSTFHTVSSAGYPMSSLTSNNVRFAFPLLLFTRITSSSPLAAKRRYTTSSIFVLAFIAVVVFGKPISGNAGRRFVVEYCNENRYYAF